MATVENDSPYYPLGLEAASSVHPKASKEGNHFLSEECQRRPIPPVPSSKQERLAVEADALAALPADLSREIGSAAWIHPSRISPVDKDRATSFLPQASLASLFSRVSKLCCG